MPYKSLAQERWAHTPSGKAALGSAGVAEWDAATKGKKLPEKKAKGGEVGDKYLVEDKGDHFRLTPKDRKGPVHKFVKKAMGPEFLARMHAHVHTPAGVQHLDEGGTVDPAPAVPAFLDPAVTGQDPGAGVTTGPVTPPGSPPAASGGFAGNVNPGNPNPAAAKAQAVNAEADDAAAKAVALKKEAGEVNANAAKVAATQAATGTDAASQDAAALKALTVQPMQVPLAPVAHVGKGTLDALEAQKGLNEQTAADTQAEARKEGDIQAAAREAAQARYNTYQATRKTISDSLDQARAEYAAGKINPDDYWQHKDTGSKIASVLGVLLSGYGQGRSAAAGINTPNAAMAIIQKRIEQNIDAQKANLATKGNLVKFWGDKLGDADAGAKVAEAHDLNILQSQLNEAAARYRGTSAENIAASANNQVEIQKQQLLDQAAQATAVNKFNQGAQQAQANQTAALTTREHAINYLGMKGRLPATALAELDPKDQARALFVPGTGNSRVALATDADAKKDAAKALAPLDDVENAINQIQVLRNKHNGYIPPTAVEDREAALHLANVIAGHESKGLFSRNTEFEFSKIGENTPQNFFIPGKFEGATKAIRQEIADKRRSIYRAATGAELPSTADETRVR